MTFSCHKRIQQEYRKISGESPNVWKLNNILQNNPWIKKEIQWPKNNNNTNYSEMLGKEKITYQNLQDAARTVYRKKYIAVNVYIRKRKNSNS